MFLREALDKVGFQADMLSAGDYKTAVNLYTETTFTAEHREMAQSLNRDIYEQLVAGISEGRELTLARVRALIDDGPYRAADTVRVGLVDALVYEDQMIDGLPLGSTAPIVDYADYRQVILPGETGSRVALVYAEGVINFGSNAAITIEVVRLSKAAEKKKVIVHKIHIKATFLFVVILSVINANPS